MPILVFAVLPPFGRGLIAYRWADISCQGVLLNPHISHRRPSRWICTHPEASARNLLKMLRENFPASTISARMVLSALNGWAAFR